MPPPRFVRLDSFRPAAVAGALLAWAALSPAQTSTVETTETPASAPATQPADQATALPEVKARVSRETATGPVPGYRATRSATATKTDTPLNEVPQSISVITAEQVTDQASQTLQDALRYTAGVRSEMYGVDNRGDWFSMRGGSEGSTLLDGLRLPLTGWWGVLRNEPYAFERIEVLRGPASVVAGQNGPGGVVNLVSKRPLSEPLREVAVQFGSHDHKQLSADLSGPVNEDGSLLYRVVALTKDSGTQVDHAFDKRNFVAPSLTWRPNADVQLTAFAEYQRDESGNVNAFYPYQGTLLPAPNGPLPYDTFIGEPDWDTYGGERTRLGYHFELRLDDDWTLRQNLRHDRIDGELRTMYAAWWDGFVDATGTADPNGTYLNRVWYANDDTGRISNADLTLEGRLRFGKVQHTLLASVDGMSMKSDHWEWADGAATPLDVYHPVFGSFPLPPLDRADSGLTHTKARRWGVLLQDQIKFDERWVVVGALRHDKSRNNDQQDSATTKNLGVVFLADGGWSPYASYSESFEPITDSTSASGEPFKPLRGKQIEAGVKWQPANPRVSASAAVFKLKETNRLVDDPGTQDPNDQMQAGEITSKGFELEVAANLPAWDLTASYTYIDARTTESTNTNVLDQQLYGIPRNAAALWALYKFGAQGLPGLRAGLGVRYNDDVGTGDASVNGTVPAVTLLDALIAYDSGSWRLALNANNLTDKTYLAGCLARGDCWFGGKRKVIGTVAYRF